MEEARKGKISLKRSVVGLFFHPAYKTIVIVLQEGGDVHAIDTSSGTVAFNYIFKAKLNSSWALDHVEQTLLVVGETGKAVLLDVNLTEDQLKRNLASLNENKETKYVDPSSLKTDYKFLEIVPWCELHRISKMDPQYVVSAKFFQHGKAFLTATNLGEVKIWNSSNLHLLALVNSPHWDPQPFL